MHRRPAARADLAAIVALYNAYDAAFREGPDSDEADLTDDWDSPGFDLATQTLVVEDSGRLVGYATVVEEHADAVTALDRSELLGELLAWIEAHPGRHEHYLPVGDEAGNALFAFRGWVPGRRFWRMRRELDDVPAAPVWPAGVTVRAYDRPADDEAVHALIRTCFAEIGGQPERTLAQWRAALVETERFDPALMLVAVDGDRVVGAALAQAIAEPNAFGFVRQLAVAPSHRGRGLALGLLHASFRSFAERGLPAAVLGVDAANPTGALQLYERAGMRVHEQFTRWDR